jgi:hypothetical protein
MELNIANVGLIVGILSGIATCLVIVTKTVSKMKDDNKKIYSDFFGVKFSQLFEYKKTNERPNIRFHSDNFNPIEISSFCSKVVDFKSKGNKFRGIRTRILFNCLHKVAKNLDEKTDGLTFAIGSFMDSDETYLEFYKKNGHDFNRLKTRFIRFYLRIYPILD